MVGYEAHHCYCISWSSHSQIVDSNCSCKDSSGRAKGFRLFAYSCCGYESVCKKLGKVGVMLVSAGDLVENDSFTVSNYVK